MSSLTLKQYGALRYVRGDVGAFLALVLLILLLVETKSNLVNARLSVARTVGNAKLKVRTGDEGRAFLLKKGRRVHSSRRTSP